MSSRIARGLPGWLGMLASSRPSSAPSAIRIAGLALCLPPFAPFLQAATLEALSKAGPRDLSGWEASWKQHEKLDWSAAW